MIRKEKKTARKIKGPSIDPWGTPYFPIKKVEISHTQLKTEHLKELKASKTTLSIYENAVMNLILN